MLAGLVNKERGWDRGGETWSAMETLGAPGWPTWFQPGGRDLALQLARTAMPAAGRSLTPATQTLTSRLGVEHCLLPMCEQPVAAVLDTSEGLLELALLRPAAMRAEGPRMPLCGSGRGHDHRRRGRNIRRAGPRARLRRPVQPDPRHRTDPRRPGMRELIRSAGVPVLALSPFVDVLLGSGTKVFRTDLLMRGREGRRRLAGVCLDAIRAAA